MLGGPLCEGVCPREEIQMSKVNGWGRGALVRGWRAGLGCCAWRVGGGRVPLPWANGRETQTRAAAVSGQQAVQNAMVWCRCLELLRDNL